MLIFLKVVIELEKCLVEILDWTIKSSMNFSTVKLDLKGVNLEMSQQDGWAAYISENRPVGTFLS